MRAFAPLMALAASALAGHSSKPTRTGPGMLLTGCPNGYTNIMTGECKPFHLRIRDAATGDWGSHKVTDVYRVSDHPWGPGDYGGDAKDWKDGDWKDWAHDDDDDDDDEPGKNDKGKNKHPGHKNGKGEKNGKGKGKGKTGPPSDHCPNGVAHHGTGECHPFKIHARDADTGNWREHHVTGAYHIPDEKPGQHGHPGFIGGQHGGWGGRPGFGGFQGGRPGGRMHPRDAMPEAEAEAAAAMGRFGGFGGSRGGSGGAHAAHGGFGNAHWGSHQGGRPGAGHFGGPGPRMHARDAMPEAMPEAMAEAEADAEAHAAMGGFGGFGGAHGGFPGARGGFSRGGSPFGRPGNGPHFGGPGPRMHARDAMPEAMPEAEADAHPDAAMGFGGWGNAHGGFPGAHGAPQRGGSPYQGLRPGYGAHSGGLGGRMHHARDAMADPEADAAMAGYGGAPWGGRWEPPRRPANKPAAHKDNDTPRKNGSKKNNDAPRKNGPKKNQDGPRKTGTKKPHTITTHEPVPVSTTRSVKTHLTKSGIPAWASLLAG